MDLNGYWKFHRAMYLHPIWKKTLSTRIVWITILGHANFTDKDWLSSMGTVSVKAGSFITTQRNLAKLSGVSRKQVRTAIKDLIETGSIRANQRANRFTEIVVINWPIYQGREFDEGQPKGQPVEHQGQPVGMPGPRRKKDKNENTYSDDFIVFWSAYPNKKAKADAYKAWKKIGVENGMLERILSALSLQKLSHEWTKDGGQFIPHPATWLNGKRWEDELASNPADPYEKFQRL